MGLRNGPPHFKHCMSKTILTSCLQRIAGIVIDDLDSGGADHIDCACNLSLMLDALKSYHVQAGGDKLELGSTAVPFLGYLLKKGKLHCDPSKTAAIECLIPTETRLQLRAFLGLAGYYRHFIKGIATIARPLYLLLQENTAWHWDRVE